MDSILDLGSGWMSGGRDLDKQDYIEKPLRWIILAWLCLFAAAESLDAREPIVEGGKLQFALPDLDGNIVTSSDERFDGKVVLVTLWGMWCPPCLTEIPTFNALQEGFGEAGLVIVAIAFERDPDATDHVERLRQFSEKHGIVYLVLDGGATRDFTETLPMIDHVKGLPVEIVIDRSGEVVEARHGYGYRKRWARELEQQVMDLLAAERQ